MAKVALRGVLFASCFVFAVACGGDDGGGDGIVFVDAGPQTDGGNNSATCNPVSQQGCEEGEKCASVLVQESPLVVSTLCVPDGTIAEGGECTPPDTPGTTTGYDDCQAFNECVFGICRPVCRQQGGTPAGTCQGENVCQLFNSLFDDLDTNDVGICIPQCDPVTGISDATPPVVDYSDQCGTLQCYMNLFDGIGVCSASFMGAPGTGESCGDSCALNGCAPGNGPLLPGGSLTEWQQETVFFANTIFGLADVCIQFCDTTLWAETPGCDVGGGPGCNSGDFNANCPLNHECRSVTGLYLNFDDPSFAPDSFGLCLDTVTQDWGSCKDHVIDDVEAYLTEQGQDPVPVPADNGFIPGCSTGQAVRDKIDELTAPMMAAPGATKKTFRKELLQRDLPPLFGTSSI